MLAMTRPIVTLYASELGAGTMEVGVLTSMYSFLPLLLAVHAGKFADRVGDRLPIFLGMMGCVLGTAVPYFIPSLYSLYLSQVIIGISHIAVNLSLQNALGHITTDKNRDQYYGVFSTVAAMAAFAGPVAGGYVSEHSSYAIAFLIAGLVCIPPCLISLSLSAEKKKPKAAGSSGMSALSLLKMPQLRIALMSSALVMYSRDIFVAYFPLYAQTIQLSDSAIGWIIAIQALAMAPVRLYMSRLVDWMGRERLLLSSILLAGVSFMLVPFFDQMYILIVLSALMGFGLGVGQPLSMATIYTVSPRDRTGEVLGLRLAANRLSQIIAPLFFGLVGNWIGLVSVFYVSGAFLIGGAGLTRTKSEQCLNRQ